MADDEKKPSLISNWVALHKASEKKPIGSHSVLDLNLRLVGHNTLFFKIFQQLYYYFKYYKVCWQKQKSCIAIFHLLYQDHKQMKFTLSDSCFNLVYLF